MYDKPVKWIHLGLQESSLINSDIYSHGFNAAIPPPVKHRAGMAGFSDAIRGVIYFAGLCCKEGRRNRALVPGPCESRMAPLPVPLLLGLGKKTQIRYVCTNPPWLITHQGNEAELIGQSYSGDGS